MPPEPQATLLHNHLGVEENNQMILNVWISFYKNDKEFFRTASKNNAELVSAL